MRKRALVSVPGLEALSSAWSCYDSDGILEAPRLGVQSANLQLAETPPNPMFRPRPAHSRSSLRIRKARKPKTIETPTSRLPSRESGGSSAISLHSKRRRSASSRRLIRSQSSRFQQVKAIYSPTVRPQGASTPSSSQSRPASSHQRTQSFGRSALFPTQNLGKPYETPASAVSLTRKQFRGVNPLRAGLGDDS